jgi:DNA-binding MarR family transcriptional regulator
MSSRDEMPFDVTLRVRDTCLCLAVQRAARALARRFDEVLKPVALTHGQFSLLNALNRPEAPTIGTVAATLAMDRTTLTANLKPLARRRLIAVSADKADGRSRRLALTAAGHKLLLAALPLWERAHAELDGEIAPGDPKQLRRDLRLLSGGNLPAASRGGEAAESAGTRINA